METEVESLITEAKSLNLENIGILDRYSLSQIAEIYNGIGPDRFPEWLREMLDELHPSLCVVALIHDLEYYEGGAKEEFTESNERFYRNGKTVAFARQTRRRGGGAAKNAKTNRTKRPAACYFDGATAALRRMYTPVQARMHARLTRSAARQNQNPANRTVTVPLYPAGSVTAR